VLGLIGVGQLQVIEPLGEQQRAGSLGELGFFDMPGEVEAIGLLLGREPLDAGALEHLP
jgi:hypothetical protein